MKCMNCGIENEEGAKFCENCGSVLDEQATLEKKSKIGKLKYVIAAIVVAIAIGIGIYFALSGTSEKSYTDKIAMADKYVEKKDYKKAEEVYLEAIEIDPKQEDSYIKLSEVYSVQNKQEEAVAILNKAEKAVTSNEGKKKITEKKKEISSLIKFSWIVEPTIDADDMFYTALDLTSGKTANLKNIQFISPYVIAESNDLYTLIDFNGKLKDNYSYDYISIFNSNYALHRKEPKYEGEYKQELSLYYLNDDKIEPLMGIGYGGPGDALFYYTDKLESSRGEKDLAENLPMTAFPVQSGKDIVFNSEKPYAIYKKDKLITDFIYEECGSFSESLLSVKKDGKWGYVNDDGQTVIPFSYDASWVYKTNNVRDTSQTLEEKEYAYAASGGYVNLVKDGKWELRNIEGNLVIRPGTFEKILPVIDNKCWVKKDGKWGVISLGVKQEEKEAVTETVTSEDYQNIYKPVLQEVSKQYGESNIYYLHDIDKNGIKELIVEEGTNLSNCYYKFYTIENKKIVSLDRIPGSHCWFHVDDKTGNEPYIVKVYGHMGMEELSEVSIQDGKITENRISSRELGPNDKYFDTESIPYEQVNSYGLLEK